MKLLSHLFYELVARNLPGSGFPLFGPLFKWLRYICVKKLSITCGQGVNCESRASVDWANGLSIGNYSGIGYDSVVQCPVRIGEYVMMGPECLIYRCHGHGFSRTDVPMQHQRDDVRSELEICDDVWIGRRVIILQGCKRIGRGAIVGAGAVVTKNVPDWAVVVGNPARVVKMRKEN